MATTAGHGNGRGTEGARQGMAEAVRARLAPVFRADAAREADHVYQFAIAGDDAFHLEIRAGRFEVGDGAHAAPSVRFLFEDVDTALGIVTGEIDPMAAFMAGRIRTDGNLILALQLGLLFRP
ncbi:MAG TPA: SCP2 sterol-binding domain-containing protein [Pseudomonadales bacterium]|nr:SCP2 sterol-binding domain-containing protein [Pseudomonadales bacterium]